jgi:hypothetical protein
MITYTFKANPEFYEFKDIFQDVYIATTSKIQSIEEIKSSPAARQTVEEINGEDYWCVSLDWPNIDCFKATVKIFAEYCTDDMIEYLNSHDVFRYISIIDDQGNILFPETKIPNIKGEEYIQWVDSILGQ